PKEMWRLRKIEKYTRKKVTKTTLPTIEQIQAHRETQLMDKMEVWIKRGRCSREKELVNALIERGHDPVMLAAIALKLARAEEKQRPIPRIDENVTEASREPRRRRDRSGNRGDFKGGRSGPRGGGENGRKVSKRSHEKGMVRLIMKAGKADGVRPNDIVGTIAFHAKIPGKRIGAIKIQNDQTFVDIPEQFIGQVMANSGKYQIHRQNIKIEKA
ncbi:MAG: DbpA RNA binding domain-containing protein, partial [Chloroflexota bacterium]